MGSTNQKYKTLTSAINDYVIPNHIHQYIADFSLSTTWTEAPDHWLQCATKDDFLHLMEKSLPGPLICVSHGKLVLMAAEHHACLISFGLEANIIRMRPEVYYKIVSKDFPGPNPDPRKSKSIQNFYIPDEFIVQHSLTTYPYTIKLFAVFVSIRWVWGINDFAGLVRMHVTSRQKPWERSDFQIGGSVTFFSFKFINVYIFYFFFFLPRAGVSSIILMVALTGTWNGPFP